MKTSSFITFLIITTLFLVSCGGKPAFAPDRDADLTEGKEPIYSSKRGILRRR